MSIADDLWEKGYLPHAWTEDERNKVQALRERIEELEDKIYEMRKTIREQAREIYREAHADCPRWEEK